MEFGVVRQTNYTYDVSSSASRIRSRANSPRCTAARSCHFEREQTWACFGAAIHRGFARGSISAFPNCLGSARGGKN